MAQLLVSRLMHDLAGPAGALGNGVELAVEGGAVDPAVSDLLVLSSKILLSRLRVMSFAFGRSDAAPLRSLIEACNVVENFAATRTKLSVTFPKTEAPGWLSSMLPMLVLVAADCLPKQGRIEVVEEAEDQTWRVTVSGAALRVDPSLIALLTGEPATPTTRTIPAVFAHRMAVEQGWRLDAWLEKIADEARLIMSIGKR